MGRLAKLIDFVRTSRRGAAVSDVTVNPLGGSNITVDHFADPGDDSHPLPGDFAALTSASGTGQFTAVAYLDPRNASTAQPGEKRLYSRDVNGNQKAEVWLKADGSITLTTPACTFSCLSDGVIKGSNGSGSFALLANGDFNVNGAVISASGEVTSASGKVLSSHVHPQGNDSGGNSEQDTGAPI